MLTSEWSYREGSLFCEDVDLTCVAASHGTPSYVYSKLGMTSRFHAYASALFDLPHLVCYSVKANSNLAVLSLLAREGSGFDIVSGGELYRVLAAGGDPRRVVFSGVGKTSAEIRFALEKGIHSFNCESEAEIALISQAAIALGKVARIAIRVNPDVDAVTHPYISTGLREHKFGVDIDGVEDLYTRAAALPGIVPDGVSCHIGSQILDAGPLLEAAAKIIALAARLDERGIRIRTLDLGGGLGITYHNGERAASIQAFVGALKPLLQMSGMTVMLEPGRSIVGDAGVLLTRVLFLKQNGGKVFVVVDAGMNDLIRPALYQAHHEILPVEKRAGDFEAAFDVVGPVCETGDFLARNRLLPRVKPGDLLAVQSAGAYCFVQTSNYNSRPRPCELLVDGSDVHLARRRETYEDIVHGESPLI